VNICVDIFLYYSYLIFKWLNFSNILPQPLRAIFVFLDKKIARNLKTIDAEFATILHHFVILVCSMSHYEGESISLTRGGVTRGDNAQICRLIGHGLFLFYLAFIYSKICSHDIQIQQDCLSIEGRPPANRIRKYAFAPVTLTFTADLDIRTLPRYSEDVPAYQNDFLG